MPPHPLTNFEIQKYQNKSKFNDFYSRNNLCKIKDGCICSFSYGLQISRNSLNSFVCEM